jgi:predicted  nucleic acid-binding Zn-ribbon protein
MFAEMALTKQCSMCKKELGRMHCTGCDEYFCAEDFKTHRKELSTEMNRIDEERSRLDVAINNRVQHDEQQRANFFELIEKWKNSFIEQAEKAAKEAREEVTHLLNPKQMNIITELKSFSQELVHLKDSENYVEDDLTRLDEKIRQFKENLSEATQPITIKLKTERSDAINWNGFIYVTTGKLISYIFLR